MSTNLASSNIDLSINNNQNELSTEIMIKNNVSLTTLFEVFEVAMNLQQGYEDEINHCVGMCKAIRLRPKILQAVAKKNTYKYKKKGKHRFQYACIKGNYPWFCALYQHCSNKFDMLTIFGPAPNYQSLYYYLVQGASKYTNLDTEINNDYITILQLLIDTEQSLLDTQPELFTCQKGSTVFTPGIKKRNRHLFSCTKDNCTKLHTIINLVHESTPLWSIVRYYSPLTLAAANHDSDTVKCLINTFLNAKYLVTDIPNSSDKPLVLLLSVADLLMLLQFLLYYPGTVFGIDALDVHNTIRYEERKIICNPLREKCVVTLEISRSNYDPNEISLRHHHNDEALYIAMENRNHNMVKEIYNQPYINFPIFWGTKNTPLLPIAVRNKDIRMIHLLYELSRTPKPVSDVDGCKANDNNYKEKMKRFYIPQSIHHDDDIFQLFSKNSGFIVPKNDDSDEEMYQMNRAAFYSSFDNVDVHRNIFNYTGDVNIYSLETGNTILHYFIERGDINYIYSWLQYFDRINFDHQNFEGNTVLHLAVINQNLFLINFLLSMLHVKFHIPDHNGLCPFLLAVTTGNITIVEKFVLYNFHRLRINRIDKQGNTALHIACYANDELMVAYLLNYTNIDIYIPNYNGITAYEIALGHKQPVILSLFEKKGITDAQKLMFQTKVDKSFAYDITRKSIMVYPYYNDYYLDTFCPIMNLTSNPFSNIGRKKKKKKIITNNSSSSSNISSSSSTIDTSSSSDDKIDTTTHIDITVTIKTNSKVTTSSTTTTTTTTTPAISTATPDIYTRNIKYGKVFIQYDRLTFHMNIVFIVTKLNYSDITNNDDGFICTLKDDAGSINLHHTFMLDKPDIVSTDSKKQIVNIFNTLANIANSVIPKCILAINSGNNTTNIIKNNTTIPSNTATNTATTIPSNNTTTSPSNIITNIGALTNYVHIDTRDKYGNLPSPTTSGNLPINNNNDHNDSRNNSSKSDSGNSSSNSDSGNSSSNFDTHNDSSNLGFPMRTSSSNIDTLPTSSNIHFPTHTDFHTSSSNMNIPMRTSSSTFDTLTASSNMCVYASSSNFTTGKRSSNVHFPIRTDTHNVSSNINIPMRTSSSNSGIPMRTSSNNIDTLPTSGNIGVFSSSSDDDSPPPSRNIHFPTLTSPTNIYTLGTPSIIRLPSLNNDDSSSDSSGEYYSGLIDTNEFGEFLDRVIDSPCLDEIYPRKTKIKRVVKGKLFDFRKDHDKK